MVNEKRDMSAEEMKQFAGKLEKFADGLSDNERTLLKGMLEVPGIPQRPTQGRGFDATQYRRVDIQPIRFDALAPRLDANFFLVMGW